MSANVSMSQMGRNYEVTTRVHRLTQEDKVSIYNGLSRRALIMLCNDYDYINKNQMKEFYYEQINMGLEYEKTRIPEKLIDIGDSIVEVIDFAKKSNTISSVSSLVEDVSKFFKKDSITDTITEI